MRRVRVIVGAAGIVAIAAMTILVLPGNKAEAQATAQIPLAGSSIPKWIDELPRFNVVDSTSGVRFNLTMKEFQFPILPAGAVPGYTGTYVWGYLDDDQLSGAEAKTSYLGPIVVAKRGVPTEINFVNALGKRCHDERLGLQALGRPDSALGRPLEPRIERGGEEGRHGRLRQRLDLSGPRRLGLADL